MTLIGKACRSLAYFGSAPFTAGKALATEQVRRSACSEYTVPAVGHDSPAGWSLPFSIAPASRISESGPRVFAVVLFSLRPYMVHTDLSARNLVVRCHSI